MAADRAPAPRAAGRRDRGKENRIVLDIQQQTYIEARLANEGPSPALAYFFWLFLGIVSAHRFYLGRTGTAILQIVSYFFVIGVFWFLLDAFLLPGLVRERQNEVRRRLAAELLGQSAPVAPRA
ncbi:TM2 domain-containing protein [Xanthobacter pseudotagetidis]|uniref:TM2 domain-containing protein n=1 Tax=Xanthobacter pseudotagetidis TaxID=3119911 RepID=UPI00372ABBC8